MAFIDLLTHDDVEDCNDDKTDDTLNIQYLEQLIVTMNYRKIIYRCYINSVPMPDDRFLLDHLNCCTPNMYSARKMRRSMQYFFNKIINQWKIPAGINHD